MSHKIRPAARIIRTIGSDLIKDQYAAIVELVKNSYDADSKSVSVCFEYIEEKQILSIKVVDIGHGMSFETVVDKWLVPATDDKLTRRKSKSGRVLQGRKGIGRFAASILGDFILVETTNNKKTTSLILDMEKLDQVKYLDEFSIDVETEDTNDPDGTIIEIEKHNVNLNGVSETWDKQQLNKLFIELRGLISPLSIFESAIKEGYKIQHDEFNISLNFKNFPDEKFSSGNFKLKPFPVTELYDYRVWGTVSVDGKLELSYINQNTPALPPQKIKLDLNNISKDNFHFPGKTYIDLRGFDRDPESISNLIRRGLKDPDTGGYVGKLDARRILNESYGIGVYREQFRLRPYGDQSFDWLNLDKKRVQNPSVKIGHDQVIGFVFIEPEEISGLVEKSARDGLVENKFYDGLKFVVSKFVGELEVRRKLYREKNFKGRKKRAIEEDVDSLFDFDTFKSILSKALEKQNISSESRKTIEKSIEEAIDSEKRKKSVFSEKIKETIAMYQSHATLGKLTHVLIHEGRKHIKDLKETVPRIVKWAKKTSKTPNQKLEEKLFDRSKQVVSSTNSLSHLFKKIEPLARTRRASNKDLIIMKAIETSFDIFSTDLNSNNISVDLFLDEKYKINANEMDIQTIFTNLIENSLYWIKLGSNDSNYINIEATQEKDILNIIYRDSGPGFQGSDLELMFEPGYSNKPNGTGLGLALAGDAAFRNKITIEAVKIESGAEFSLTFKLLGE